MAHRPEDVEEMQGGESKTATVWLSDLEPVLGLTAATARFCQALTPDVYAVLSQEATEALSTVQAVMWRIEHAKPDVPKDGG